MEVVGGCLIICLLLHRDDDKMKSKNSFNVIKRKY